MVSEQRKHCGIVALILTSLIFLNVTGFLHRKQNLPELYRQTSPAVVWIGAKIDEYYMGDDPYQYTIKWEGSGFLVSDNGLIATAGHVTRDTQVFEVMFQDGTRANRKVL